MKLNDRVEFRGSFKGVGVVFGFPIVYFAGRKDWKGMIQVLLPSPTYQTSLYYPRRVFVSNPQGGWFVDL